MTSVAARAQGHQIAFSQPGSNIGSALQTPAETPTPSRPSSLDYTPPAPRFAPGGTSGGATPQPGGGATPGSVQGHQISFTPGGSEMGSAINSAANTPGEAHARLFGFV